MTPTQQDHVVLLVDDGFFENLPAWVTDNFTVTPGGYHEGQSSCNKLVIFQDGTYLEFFNWYDTPPAMDQKHLPMRFWGSKTPGLIDFAITSTTHTAEECIQAVNHHLVAGPDGDGNLGIKFGEPVSGSRKKADGVEIKWKVTRPEFSAGSKTPPLELFPTGRIDVPFFCHDITPRTDRVPSQDPAKTTHPCGATGIAACEILVPKALLAEYSEVYSKIIGSKGATTEGGSTTLEIGVPLGSSQSRVVVRGAESETDTRRMQERGIGFCDLVRSVRSDGPGSERRSLGPTGIESTIWLENVDGA